ncbi:MAG: hypothetical protein A2Y41_07765 [Spirochaetes bacterium GWB1_36_13]|nr:MAG: hypothetical protein A2Y41_07765 [Spirochaetes bacterium GWB1_36_13]
MELNLKNQEWKDFVLDDIFTITSTSSGIDKNKLITKKGKIPYITRSDKDNGYESFICSQSSIYKMDKENVIIIGLDTQTVFYQPYKFYTGQNIQILQNPYLNKTVALFLIPLLKSLMDKFNWGSNGATLTRLRRSKILLPSTKERMPNYIFMKAYIIEKEYLMIKKFKKYIFQKINEKNSITDLKSLKEKEWKEFKIGKLFDKLIPGKSKGLNHLTILKRGINYLGATNQNNGVLCQVDKNEALIQKGNCIAFIRNGEGSMGYSVYKAEDFIATSDMSLGYSQYINRYSGMFITTIADKVRGKYNFGYKRSSTRLEKESILLPIDGKGNPDYQYMEKYMKQIEYKKILKYLEFLEDQNNRQGD